MRGDSRWFEVRGSQIWEEMSEVRLAHSARRQPRNISASCITISARKFCQSLGHTVGILEVIAVRMFGMFA